jgi:putative tryptophan/tyrosine transport system ATP-binding protein
VLELEHVSKSFPRGVGELVPALHDVCLEVPDANFITLVGSNGAGKSTLLNVIAGLVRPDRGIVRLDGSDISRRPEHRRAKFVGRVYQDPLAGTAPGMTIEENLALALKRGQRRRLRRAVTRERRHTFERYLELAGLGLEHRLGSLVGMLSGGQRQALALLMATISTPKVLLLDEHTAALDPGAERKIMELTESVISEGRLTALMVTQNMERALQHGDRLLMMHEQRIVLDIGSDEKAKLNVRALVERLERAGDGPKTVS